MSKQTWERETKNGSDNWKLKGYKNVEDIERSYRASDVRYMVCFLAFVVLLDSTIAGLLFAGVLRSFALRVNPSISRVWLGDEIEIVFLLTAAWVTLAQVAAIVVHARIGRLIASRME